MKKYIIDLLISFALSIILIFMLSLLICNTSLSENIIKPCMIFITSLSIFIGAFLVSKNKKEKGIINGIIFGTIYVIILCGISIILNGNFTFSLNLLLFILTGMLFGIIGGIVGVNFK